MSDQDASARGPDGTSAGPTTKIVVNGRERVIPEGATVADLLQALALDRTGVAVAVDHRVVPRSQHGQTRLAAGARVEVVQAVGGG